MAMKLKREKKKKILLRDKEEQKERILFKPKLGLIF